jgi:hypothetical protein
MPLHHSVPDTTSDFEPSTLSAATEFEVDDDDADIDTDAQLAADSGAFDAQATPQIDFAAALGPVASRWEAMLRWYEMSAPPVTH